MTKEPIMIDGVDVSGCRFYDGEFEYSCQCSCTICERNQEDCYYKNWKRKEQECEELKKSVKSNKDKRKKAIEKYIRLKEFTNKEFEKLKAELKDMTIRKIDYLKESLTYKQALQEIKEISKQINEEGIYGYVITDELDKILQK